MTEETWHPDPSRSTRMHEFIDHVARRRGGAVPWLADATEETETGRYDYHALWGWSVTELSEFWMAVSEYFDVVGYGLDGPALVEDRMPGARWFPRARLNLAENILRPALDPERSAECAVMDVAENGEIDRVSWAELASWVAAAADQLREAGVRLGDRVVAVLPNTPHAIVGLLATAAIGAVWSICSPDLAEDAILSRLQQLRPSVLIGTDGYMFNGTWFARHEQLKALAGALPTVDHVILVRDEGQRVDRPDKRDLGLRPGMMLFPPRKPAGAEFPECERLAFEHPLWVLFSSGTTGNPKGIVHGHGGILLESLKFSGLQHDMGRGDIYFVAANTSWMVWNLLIANLSAGVTAVTYSGSPTFEHPARQFELLELTGATMFAVGAAYLALVEKSEIVPRERWPLPALRTILSTGSPLAPSTWRWVHAAVKGDVHLGSDSGGTDICSGFVGSNPLTPVTLGESQGALLAVSAESWNERGERVIGEVGELVITRPMPSMPLFFWGDPTRAAYEDSYFRTYPGMWAQGDWVTEMPRHGFIVHGRSDATLNRYGVRLGSGDIYAAIQDIPQIRDALVIGVEREGGRYWMPLFADLADGVQLDHDLESTLTSAIRNRASARHVPDEYIVCPAVPVTHAGKRIEIPLKKLFSGRPLDVDAVRGTLANPDAIDWFVAFASAFARGQGLTPSGDSPQTDGPQRPRP